MPRLREDTRDFVVLNRNGEVYSHHTTVEQAELQAMEQARGRPGHSFWVAMTMTRFGLPNADPARNVLMGDDMAEPPVAPRAPDALDWLADAVPELDDEEEEL